jgi:hypothetical protein
VFLAAEQEKYICVFQVSDYNVWLQGMLQLLAVSVVGDVPAADVPISDDCS